jgi:hypothetical protein
MASRGSRDRTRPDERAERYRKAAQLTLEQLDWCIAYLQRIGKPLIARALRERRTAIAKNYGL